MFRQTWGECRARDSIYRGWPSSSAGMQCSQLSRGRGDLVQRQPCAGEWQEDVQGGLGHQAVPGDTPCQGGGVHPVQVPGIQQSWYWWGNHYNIRYYYNISYTNVYMEEVISNCIYLPWNNFFVLTTSLRTQSQTKLYQDNQRSSWRCQSNIIWRKFRNLHFVLSFTWVKTPL